MVLTSTRGFERLSMLSDRIIYGLLDPVTEQVRYVGKSKMGIKRAKHHAQPSALNVDRTHKGNWIRKLQKDGLLYEIKILEGGVEDLTWREQVWIAYGRGLGWPLTNITCGGEPGPDGYKWTPEHRAKISAANRGRQLTKDQRHRFLEAVANWQMTPGRAVALEKATSAWRGRHHTEESKKRISAGQVGKKMSLEGREKIRLANSRPIRDLTTGTIYASIKRAAEEVGLCARSICRVLKGRFSQTGGHQFEYADGQ